jgi:serine protease Do
MVPKQRVKSTPVMQWAAAGLLAASLSACSAAGVVGQVQSQLQARINGASNPQPATLQTTAQSAATATTTTPQNVVTTSQDQLYEDLYTKINPSVVNITVIMGAAQGSNSTRNSPFGNATPSPNGNATPSPNGNGQGQGVAEALGSGFVYDAQGDIVTNNHVVAGATKITVTFADGVEAAATVVGASPDADLAVIKVQGAANELHPLTLGASDALKVGEGVVAIGNPFGQAGSMSTGIVSGLGRLLADGGTSAGGGNYSIPDIVQTDAAINPGNSGGPLLDLSGHVIGVNTAIDSSSGSNSGVGYAIPADIVAQVAPALISKGKYQAPYLGISGVTLGSDLATANKLDANTRGVLVADVATGGPAEKAGLKGSTQSTTVDGLPTAIGGDVIVSIDGQAVKQFDDLLSYLFRHTAVGQQITLGVLRGGQTTNVTITLGARPTTSAGG